MDKIEDNAKNSRQEAMKKLISGSKYYLVNKSIEGFDNDIAFLNSMLDISLAAVRELKRTHDYFKGLFYI